MFRISGLHIKTRYKPWPEDLHHLTWTEILPDYKLYTAATSCEQVKIHLRQKVLQALDCPILASRLAPKSARANTQSSTHRFRLRIPSLDQLGGELCQSEDAAVERQRLHDCRATQTSSGTEFFHSTDGLAERSMRASTRLQSVRDSIQLTRTHARADELRLQSGLPPMRRPSLRSRQLVGS